MPTIGVLLCKTPNETVVKYSLQNINVPMGVAEYEFTNALPKQLKGEMPTIEELEQELEKEEFKEQLDPVDARLKSIKEKLKGIKGDEIQTPATYTIFREDIRSIIDLMMAQVMDKIDLFIEKINKSIAT